MGNNNAPGENSEGKVNMTRRGFIGIGATVLVGATTFGVVQTIGSPEEGLERRLEKEEEERLAEEQAQRERYESVRERIEHFNNGGYLEHNIGGDLNLYSNENAKIVTRDGEYYLLRDFGVYDDNTILLKHLEISNVQEVE